jgi:hypothetical protein
MNAFDGDDPIVMAALDLRGRVDALSVSILMDVPPPLGAELADELRDIEHRAVAAIRAGGRLYQDDPTAGDIERY